MTEDPRSAVDRFLLDRIDSIPHLEALLLLWNHRPRPWSVQEMANGLFLSQDLSKQILDDLAGQRLAAIVEGVTPAYRYEPEPQKDQILAAVDATYRSDLIRVSRLIHSKPSAALRDFARAFRLKKEPE
ncbi:MAG TPA: hypothetical protein VGN17_02400 [Bryobacteraceae bacterium]|jgi:hypothetical protein